MVFRAPCAKPISSNGTKSTIPSRAKSPCLDRKSTRLNSSHSQISYAVFCLKKKTILDHGDLPTPLTGNGRALPYRFAGAHHPPLRPHVEGMIHFQHSPYAVRRLVTACVGYA